MIDVNVVVMISLRIVFVLCHATLCVVCGPGLFQPYFFVVLLRVTLFVHGPIFFFFFF